MADKKKVGEKKDLHPRNRNRGPYDLKALCIAVPQLANYLQKNKLGKDTIDFSEPRAVRLLNTALLKHYYGINYWDFPKDNLCPPIPGRAEYIHLIADLLGDFNEEVIPTGDAVTCLDIGVGASCIYPIIGVSEYNWNFMGSDVDERSIKNAEKIVQLNPILKGKVICKLQKQPKAIFRTILSSKDKIDLSICNPPFHASKEALQEGNKRKVKNLSGNRKARPSFNFSGNQNELIYKGGEYQFIKNMIKESKEFSKSAFFFSTLVSKASNLKSVYKELEKYAPTVQRTIEIKTGNKISRIVAWSYLSAREQKAWRKNRWISRN